jgi:hypothetical protein
MGKGGIGTGTEIGRYGGAFPRVRSPNNRMNVPALAPHVILSVGRTGGANDDNDDPVGPVWFSGMRQIAYLTRLLV